MLKKNNDGDLPVDVALRWHPVGSEVAEAFADASKRAKEVRLSSTFPQGVTQPMWSAVAGRVDDVFALVHCSTTG